MRNQNVAVFDLTGRVALITGGGSGIGRECANILAEAGAAVVIVGRRIDKLKSVQEEIMKKNGKCAIFAADLTNEEACKKTVAFCVEQFGRLDIVVNSAGGRGVHGELEKEFLTENLNYTMSVDFNSAFFVIKYAYPECAKQGVGSIINIASLAALSARGPIVYSAAKGAMKSMGKTLAKRLGDKNVRVNTIYPGFILTEMTEGILSQPTLVEKFASESPLHLFGEPKDIGYCALYLASDAARFVTGQDFVIDGGATC